MKTKATTTMKDVNEPRDFRSEVDRTDYPAMDPILKEAHVWAASPEAVGEDYYQLAVKAYLAGRNRGVEAMEELEHLCAEMEALKAGIFALTKERDLFFTQKQDIGSRYNVLRGRLIELGEDV